MHKVCPPKKGVHKRAPGWGKTGGGFVSAFMLAVQFAVNPFHESMSLQLSAGDLVLEVFWGSEKKVLLLCIVRAIHDCNWSLVSGCMGEGV